MNVMASAPNNMTTPTNVPFDVTVISADGLRKTLCAWKFYVEVRIGQQTQVTPPASVRSGAQVVWDEKFTFNVRDVEIHINLYRQPVFGMPVLLATIDERLEPRNAECSTPIHPGGRRSAITIKFRVGGIINNTPSTPKCRVFALIIGVDKYASPDFRNLRGCANDANSIKKYLQERLHVPDSQIRLLLNDAAKRDAIISNFQEHLIDNENIGPDDAIIFYFAGHGSHLEGPDKWQLNGEKIQTICPHDDGTENAMGRVHGIPDRTINALLMKLSNDRNTTNITVIFDSCHSGNIARDASSMAQPLVRFSEATFPIPADLDKNIWSVVLRGAHTVPPAGFKHEGTKSHILLAACESDEFACESTSTIGDLKRPCGAFTNALLVLLYEVTPHEITYRDLGSRLLLARQHPQVTGAYKHRRLFNKVATVFDPKSFDLTKNADEKIVVKAGSIHGVVEGTEFAIQAPNAPPDTDQCLGYLRALSVSADSSILVTRDGDAGFTIPQWSKAHVSNWNNDQLFLKVFVQSDSPESAMSPADEVLVQQAQESDIPMKNYALVNSVSRADVIINDVNGNLQVQRLDDLIPKYATPTVQLENNSEHLSDILNAIAHFNFYLRHHNRGDSKLSQEVNVELYRLDCQEGMERQPITTDNLLCGPVSYVKDARYGLAIVNTSTYDLFPYLFYFDPLTYEISDWYIPANGQKAPLRRRDNSQMTVTVGYGRGGGHPVQLHVPPGQTSDTGFIKLFLSTTYVNMDWMSQKPPYHSHKRGARLEPEYFSAMWGSQTSILRVSKLDSAAAK